MSAWNGLHPEGWVPINPEADHPSRPSSPATDMTQPSQQKASGPKILTHAQIEGWLQVQHAKKGFDKSGKLRSFDDEKQRLLASFKDVHGYEIEWKKVLMPLLQRIRSEKQPKKAPVQKGATMTGADGISRPIPSGPKASTKKQSPISIDLTQSPPNKKSDKASESKAIAESTFQQIILDDFEEEPEADRIKDPKVKALIDYIQASENDTSRSPLDSEVSKAGLTWPSLFDSNDMQIDGDYDNDSHNLLQRHEEAKNCVLFSDGLQDDFGRAVLPQYALLGRSQHTAREQLLPSNEVFQNTNMPFSTFICGLQGSGKSHTMSCILENHLVETPLLGRLNKPLSALVLHYGSYSSSLNFRVCEAAFLGFPNPQIPSRPCVKPITILAAPSNFHNLKALYSEIPGVQVRPFKFRARDMNIGSILSLMNVDQKEAQPLYMGTVTKILRDIATMNAGRFHYPEFKRQLKAHELMDRQLAPLNQRMDLLESFLDLEAGSATKQSDLGNEGLTIIDLSCPFVDPGMACALFDIAVGLYLSNNKADGKVIAVDEAHKYMTDSPSSKALTETLLTIIRQQRHLGARVIISTQEPTISPRLMDLCSMTVIHRFTSPAWFDMLRQHLAMASPSVTSSNDATTANGDRNAHEQVFAQILALRTGEALVFASSAQVSTDDGSGQIGFTTLGSRPWKIKMRKRVTWDGGKSVMAV